MTKTIMGEKGIPQYRMNLPEDTPTTNIKDRIVITMYDLKSLLLDKKKELEEEQRVTQLQIDDPDMTDLDECDLKADRAIIHHQIDLIDTIWGSELK